MISFAGKVKSELCRMGISRLCCARAEGYGVLLYCNTFMPGEVRIITESGDFAARLPKLFHKAFGVKCDRVPEEKVGKGKLIFGITEPDAEAFVQELFPVTAVTRHGTADLGKGLHELPRMTVTMDRELEDILKD